MNTLKNSICWTILKLSLLIGLGLMLVACTYQNELPDFAEIKAWPRVVNRNQDKKTYYLHWQQEAHEVHYAYITTSEFCAWLNSYEDIPESIKKYTDLPQEVKAPGRLDEVHIYLYDRAENPYGKTIEIERRWIRTIVVKRYDEGLEVLTLFAKVLSFIIDMILYDDGVFD